jgi:hypothetical protein
MMSFTEEKTRWQSEKGNESFWKAFNTPSSPKEDDTAASLYRSPAVVNFLLDSPEPASSTKRLVTPITKFEQSPSSLTLQDSHPVRREEAGTRRKLWVLPADTENFVNQIPLHNRDKNHDHTSLSVEENEFEVGNHEDKENRACS